MTESLRLAILSTDFTSCSLCTTLIITPRWKREKINDEIHNSRLFRKDETRIEDYRESSNCDYRETRVSTSWTRDAILPPVDSLCRAEERIKAEIHKSLPTYPALCLFGPTARRFGPGCLVKRVKCRPHDTEISHVRLGVPSLFKLDRYSHAASSRSISPSKTYRPSAGCRNPQPDLQHINTT